MKRRWYDHYPTVSMAISLLQNTSVAFRNQTTDYMNAKIQHAYPEAWKQVEEDVTGFWSFMQKRQSLNEETWLMIERLHYIPDAEREKLAIEIIRYIYYLEHMEDNDGIFCDPIEQLNAVL